MRSQRLGAHRVPSVDVEVLKKNAKAFAKACRRLVKANQRAFKVARARYRAHQQQRIARLMK